MSGKQRSKRFRTVTKGGQNLDIVTRLRRAVYAANRRADEAEAQNRALREIIKDAGLEPDPF